MRHVLAALLLLTASAAPARAECRARISGAPRGLEIEIERALASDGAAACDLAIELEVIGDGYRVRAVDRLGRARERVVDRADVVPVLIASWAVDSLGELRPEPPPRAARRAWAPAYGASAFVTSARREPRGAGVRVQRDLVGAAWRIGIAAEGLVAASTPKDPEKRSARQAATVWLTLRRELAGARLAAEVGTGLYVAHTIDRRPFTDEQTAVRVGPRVEAALALRHAFAPGLAAELRAAVGVGVWAPDEFRALVDADVRIGLGVRYAL